MTTAENIQELHDGGYENQAHKMAERESVGYEYQGETVLRYWFTDGSEWAPPTD